MNRRRFLQTSVSLGAAAGAAGAAHALAPIKRGLEEPRLKVSVAAYSFRQYLNGDPPRMTLPDFIDLCAKMGCDGVELTSYYFPRQVTTAYLAGLKRQCFLLGLDVSGTAAGNSWTKPPGPEREQQVAGVKRWIGYGAVLGAPAIRVFGGNTPQGSTDAEARRWVAECLTECALTGAEHGVMLALENHGGVTATASGVLAIIEQVESEWVGLNLDCGNFRTDPYAEIEQCAPYAVTTHVKSEIGGKPADLGRIAGILKAANYRAYLSLEYEAREDPMTAVPRLVDEIRALV